jgi:DNA-binding MarR family transcriptional regulator
MAGAWGWMLFAHARVLNALGADLLEQHDLPLTWFDVLNRLREAPDQRLRMTDLGERLVFSKSGLTRLIDRIEAAGLVRRERSTEDRRAVYVAITQEGNDKIDEVFPDHIESIERHFGSHLSRRDAEALRSASIKLMGGDVPPDAIHEMPPRRDGG